MHNVCWLLGFFILALPIMAQAHVLITDGSIGAVLHIDPLDDPIVGEPAHFYYDVKDKNNQFGAIHCDCRLIIRNSQGKLIEDLKKEDNSFDTSVKFTTTFAKPDVYTIVFTGQPLHNVPFDSFTLSYQLRVARTGTTQLNLKSKSWQHIAHAGSIVGAFGILWILSKHNEKKQQNRSRKESS